MTITDKYKITEKVDFIDVELDTDNKLFVDPYLMYISRTDIGNECSNRVVDFFSELLKFARLNNKLEGYRLVKHLQENNEIRFGYSKGHPSGNGFGSTNGKEMFDALCKSKAVTTGLVSDIYDASIMIKGVSYDKISDLTVNIILEKLVDFTLVECEKYGIPVEEIKMYRPVWSSERKKWLKNVVVKLPVHNGKPIIFVPIEFAKPKLIYSPYSFYNDGMMPYYEKEVMRCEPSTGLVRILKRGKVPVKTNIRKQFPCMRENIISFIEEHPESYESFKYKKLNYVNINNV